MKKEQLERRQKEAAAKAEEAKQKLSAIKDTDGYKYLYTYLSTKRDMYTKIAQDGEGMRDGNAVRLTPEERITYLDKSTCLVEVLTFLDNMTKE